MLSRGVAATVVLYAVLHGAGAFLPVSLWGTDQVHFVPAAGVALGLTLVAGLGLVAHRPTCLGLLSRGRRAAQWVSRTRARRCGLAALGLFGALLAGIHFRVQVHHLGDSQKWFDLFAMAAGQSPADESLHLVAGLEWLGPVAAFEPLDVILHYQAYRLGAWLNGWEPQDAYAALSWGAGLVYLWVAWRLSRDITAGRLARTAAFGALITLGSMQLYCGYGESYTLVSVAAAYYLHAGLRVERRRGRGIANLSLLLAASLHVMALAFLPSLLYLLAKTSLRGRALLRAASRPHRAVPLALAVAATGATAYAYLYPHSLPLWPGGDVEGWSVLSPAHLAVVANALLLVSPFGLIWAAARGRSWEHQDIFLALAAAGPAALILLHDAYLGPRDWDLLSFPSLPVALFGLRRLLAGPAALRRAVTVLLVANPVMAVHTAAWIAINADPVLGTRRLGPLLEIGNQPDHYRAYARAHYILHIAHGDPGEAEALLREALDELPAPDPIRRRQYGRFLVQACYQQQKYAQAHEVFTEIYATGPPVHARGDIPAHRVWLDAVHSLEAQRRHEGRVAESEALLRAAAERCGGLITTVHDGLLLLQCADMLARQERTAEAQRALRRALGEDAPAPVRQRAFYVLGISLLKEGREAAAIDTLHHVIGTPRLSGGVDLGQYLRAADVMLSSDDFTSAAAAYRTVLAEEPANATVLLNLGWAYYRLGRLAEAVELYERALEHTDSSVARFNLALACLAAGETERALTEYGAAVDRYGPAEARRVGAVHDLRSMPHIVDAESLQRALEILTESRGPG